MQMCACLKDNMRDSNMCFAFFAWFARAALLAEQNTWSIGAGLCLNARTQR